jgi:GAF domain-containing protein
MIPFLAFITTLINLFGLAVCLCLGFYIVTRTPRSRTSWLAALLLWSLTGFYLHNAMALHVPGSGLLPWLRPAIMFALPFGFHLILLLPLGKEPARRDFYLPLLRLPEAAQRRLGDAPRAAVPLAYLLALGLTLGGVFPFPMAVPPADASGPAVLLSDQAGGPIHPLSVAYLSLFCALAWLHLWQGRKSAANPRTRRRYTPLLGAVLLTFLGGAYLALGISLSLPLPSFPGDLAVGIAAVTVGYLVARHHARVQGVNVQRDLLYIALVVGSLTIFYVVVAEILYLGGHIFSPLTLILIILVAISSLMLYDGLRTAVDRLFYREQFQQLRANLRGLAREASIGQALPDRLQAILSALCRVYSIKGGCIALREGDAFVCQASQMAVPVGQALAAPVVTAAEIVELPRPVRDAPDADAPEGMVLLVPLYDGEDQIGALLLGAKESGRPYGEADWMLFEDLADQLVAVIQSTRLQEEHAQAISEMVSQFREREHVLQRQTQQMLAGHEEGAGPAGEETGDAQFVPLVEDALRQLHDFSYLGEHALAQLAVVDWELARRDHEFLTHIDRGKALSEVLVRAVGKLRPGGPEPARHSVPPREWQPYVILYDAYVLGELNRDIMSRLYVGEGTFNRTRRRAIRAVARALQEMEKEAQKLGE